MLILSETDFPLSYGDRGAVMRRPNWLVALSSAALSSVLLGLLIEKLVSVYITLGYFPHVHMWTGDSSVEFINLTMTLYMKSMNEFINDRKYKSKYKNTFWQKILNPVSSQCAHGKSSFAWKSENHPNFFMP